MLSHGSVIFKLLAGFSFFITCRHDDIRRNALTLRAATVYAVEFLDRVLNRTQRWPFRTQHLIVNTVQGAILLDGAFPKGRFTNDQRSAIIPALPQRKSLMLRR